MTGEADGDPDVNGAVRRLTGGTAALSLVISGLVIGASGAGAAVSPDAAVLVDEVYGGGGNSGALYTRDFVELYNPGDAAVPLDGWSVQYASAAGSSWQVTPLSGQIAAGGHLLVGEASGAGGSTPITPDVEGGIAMSAQNGKVALASSLTPLSCATGCADVPDVVDLVGYGTASSYAGTGPAPQTSNTTSVARDADHTHTADNAADFTAGEPTPQAATAEPDPDPDPSPSASPTDDPDPDPAPDVAIAEIQGTGTASPLVGQVVRTEGVVTATYPTGGYRGYTIQTPGTGGGTGARTASDAVFVFSAATVAAVEIGDHVAVTGTVSEFAGLTELTVATADGLTVLDEPADPVTPVSTPWPAQDADREALESMLYAPTGDFTVTNTYATHQYGEVGLAAGTTPLLQPTEVAAPGTPESAAVAADNAARAVTLDDGASTNFLSAANTSQTPPYVSLTDPVRVGAAVTFTAPVVVDYRNDLWKLSPTTQVTPTDPASAPVTFENDRTTAPDVAALGDDGADDLRVASFNVLNYFTTLGVDDPTCVSYPDRAGDGVTVREGCPQRGAWDDADLARQQAKIVAAISSLDADVVGLMEIENSLVVDGTADEALATLVEALNTAAGSDVWAYVPSSTELPAADQQDVITNALIYRVGAVERTGESRALGGQSAPDQAFGNARVPIGQVFTPAGGGEPFLVVVNHLKSKGSAGPWPGDADTGDGQGASNESRVRQAQALADWVPTVQGDAEAVVLVGDFNSYTQEDPLRLLYDAGYADATSTLDAGEYSYSFSGLSGSLDHVLLNEAALARATGADVWNINAGESVALEYSRYNAVGTLFYVPDAYRSSDHDPVLVGLSADASADDPVDLTLLDINDFHGRIDTNTVKFAGTIETERAAAEAAGSAVALLSAGDNIGASLFASAVAQDQPTIDVLNALDLAASAVGNHEFDRGYTDLVDRVIDGGNNAQFPYLGANVYLKGTQDPALDEYTVLDLDGVRVGVIGAITQETPTLVTPGGVAMLDFGDPVEAVNRVAAELTDGDESNGEADVLVASYHEGAGAGTPDGATLEEEVAAGGAFAEIVTQTSAAVDVIFTGHTHKQYAWDAPVPGVAGATRPIVQTGSYGENIGRVRLTYDPATDTVTAHDAATVARVVAPTGTTDAAFQAGLVATYPRVAAVKGIVDAAIAAAAVVGDQPRGSVTADITTAYSGGSYTGPGGTYVPPNPADPSVGRDDRSKESTLGSLVADALLDTLAAPERGGAQIGVVNPGGLRAELFYAPDGVVTYAEANAVLPFVNNLWTTTLTGAQVTQLLEQQWQTNPDGTIPSRPYLQLGLSDNVTYTYDATRSLGDRITSVTVDGTPLDPAASYRVGTFSFLAQGGDNFRVFTQGTGTADSGLIDRDAWIAYLEANPGLSPDFAERAVGVPELQASVDAGSELSFPVTGLDLTSLGAPANTALDVQLDGTSLGTATVASGAATVTVTVPAGTTAGEHALTLTASPSGTTVTLPVVVEPGTPELIASTTTLTADRTRQVYRAPTGVTFTARVTVADGSRATGAVDLVVGETVLATVPLRADGTARYRLPASTPAGTLSVVARYAGTDTVAPSQSAPLEVVVAKVTSTTVLASTASSTTRGGWLPTLLIVGVVQDNLRVAAGTVQLYDGTRLIGSQRLVLGAAISVLPRNLAVGRHTLTAVFVPDDPANHEGSTSAPVVVRVR
ncbi:ExeM/NucH family extracellular endonuclease [Cellulomonas hominis]